MPDGWFAEHNCDGGDSCFLRLKWVLISTFKVMLAPPAEALFPLSFAPWVHLFLHRLPFPCFTRFLIRKDLFFRTIVSTGWGNRRRDVTWYLDIWKMRSIWNYKLKIKSFLTQEAGHTLLILFVGEELHYGLKTLVGCEINCGLHPAFVYLFML